MKTDPTRRFSDRVDNYVKYRPHYPKAVLTCLQVECGLTATAVIADVGAGTGILSQLFLHNGNPVRAVEPNPEMRAAAVSLLSHYPNFFHQRRRHGRGHHAARRQRRFRHRRPGLSLV